MLLLLSSERHFEIARAELGRKEHGNAGKNGQPNGWLREFESVEIVLGASCFQVWFNPQLFSTLSFFS